MKQGDEKSDGLGYSIKERRIAGWEGWFEDRSRSSTQLQENEYPALDSCSCFVLLPLSSSRPSQPAILIS